MWLPGTLSNSSAKVLNIPSNSSVCCAGKSPKAPQLEGLSYRLIDQVVPIRVFDHGCHQHCLSNKPNKI